MKAPIINRSIPLSGAYNVRDLGDYPTRDGQRTQHNRVLRADSLHRLTDADQQKLRDLGLNLVIDLRRADEVDRQPNVFAASTQVQYRHLSLFGDPSANPRTNQMPKMPDSLFEVYRGLLDGAQAAFREVFLQLASHHEGAVLVHCTAGKDRTGLVVALLLDAAGVPGEFIVEDYTRTGELITPLLDDLRAHRPPFFSVEQYERLLTSAPEDMVRTLNHLQSHYGGAQGYLGTIGLGRESIQHISRMLLD